MKSRRLRSSLCIATGPWQLLVLSCALQHRVVHEPAAVQPAVLLILAQPNQELAAAWMRDIAPHIYPWHAILCFNEVDFLWAKEEWPVPLESRFCSFRKQVTAVTGAVSELWVDYLPAVGQRVFAEAYPNARLVVYEDGLSTYSHYHTEEKSVARQFNPLRRWRSVLKGTWQRDLVSHRLHTWKMPPNYQRRLKETWLILGDLFPVPDCLKRGMRMVDHDIIRQQMAVVQNQVRFSAERRSERPHVVLLAQPFTHWGLITDKQELAMYGQLLSELVEAGWEVLWKDHPRSSSGLGDALLARYRLHVSRLDLPAVVPIDAVMDAKAWDACLAAYSTTLFYAKYVHKVPAYSFGNLVMQTIQNAPDVNQKASAALAHVPDYRVLLQSTDDYCSSQAADQNP